MAVIGFNFNKVSAIKHAPVKGNITVNRKCEPTDVEGVTIANGPKALRFTFTFGVEYQPKIAEMELLGDITMLFSEDITESTLKRWKDKHDFPPKVLEEVMNNILNRCHVQALMLSRELSLPPPFNLPRVRVQEPKQVKSVSAKQGKKDEKSKK